MVNNILPEILALSVVFVAAFGEIIHQLRINRIKQLAFGPTMRPAAWSRAVPVLRTLALGAAVWGFASLLLVVDAQVHNENAIDDSELKHLVLIVDVSPSMRLVDAGPNGDRSRRQRASDIVESLFSRIPMQQFKISFIAVYSDAKMLLEDSRDHEVIRHIMESMPLWHGFKPGKTKLISGITQAAKVAKSWAPDSAHVLMLTDGDTVPAKGMPKLPPSIADFVVVGVGDSVSGSYIHGHQSRQDINTLRQVANRMSGVFHNGNKKHLTSQIAGRFLTKSKAPARETWSRREWSLLAAVIGSAIFAVLPVLLHYFGTSFVAGTKATALHASTA